MPSNSNISFEWDRIKDMANFKKHKVRFDEAKTIFNDPLMITFADTEHSINEQRFVSIGTSCKLRILTVVFTDRNNKIRIISSRKGTIKEKKIYEET